MGDHEQALLITVSGEDRPGISSALFRVLDLEPATIIDVEQVTINGRLTLAVLISVSTIEGAQALATAVRELATANDLQCDVIFTNNETESVVETLHVTVIGQPLKPLAMAQIAESISTCDGNIERINRLARSPVTALEFDVSGADLHALKEALTRQAISHSVDIAVQRGGLGRHRKRLVVIDVDSTLIQDEVIDLLAAKAEVADEVKAITELAMTGQVDFVEAVKQRVGLLAGLSTEALAEVRTSLRLTPGARNLIDTLKLLDHEVAVVSGGFKEIIDPLLLDLNIHLSRANSLEIADGKLTGRLQGAIVDRIGKKNALLEFAKEVGVSLSQCVAIGDGANDLDMISAAGLGIAFNAKEVVRKAADTSLSNPFLDSVLYLLGIPSDMNATRLLED